MAKFYIYDKAPEQNKKTKIPMGRTWRKRFYGLLGVAVVVITTLILKLCKVF